MSGLLGIFTSAPVLCVFLHMYPVRGDTAFLSFTVVSFVCLLYATLIQHITLFSALETVACRGLVLLSGTLFWTLLYRMSPFHPLARFPGPVLYRLSEFTMAYTISRGKRHLVVRDLHAQYGSIIRIGPNSISIKCQDAVLPIYAQAKSMDKSNAYILGREKSTGLFFIPHRETHNARRSIWSNAFTPSALESYIPRIERRAKELVTCMLNRTQQFGNSVDAGQCFQHWGYDTMGDLVFGGINQIELMAEGDPHGYVRCGQAATATFEILGEATWLLDILWHLSSMATKDIHALESLAERLMHKRQQDTSSSHDDLCSYLLGEKRPNTIPLTDGELTVDALFAIQAGSDSTASVLTFAVFFLIMNPEKLGRLIQELEDAAGQTEVSPRPQILAGLPYLNAVILESLRLGTPFPGLSRVVPEQGLEVSGVSVPPGTIVSVPAYTQQTSVDNFSPLPLEFIPERWLDTESEEFNTRRSALMCFSYGAFSCLGRNLAIQELRLALTQLVLNLEMKFAPAFDPVQFLADVDNIKTTFFRYSLRLTVRSRERETPTSWSNIRD